MRKLREDQWSFFALARMLIGFGAQAGQGSPFHPLST